MKRLVPLLLLTLLAGCDMLGIESPEKVAANREADGKAIGGACRHAGRAIEDCYALNKKADRAAVFAGWREMNDYMRENQIAEVAPQVAATGAAAKPAADEPDSHAEEKSPAKNRDAKAKPKRES
ncbi:hypothetical protein FSC37_01150 [Piscinibacter aquaticus]|uniref:EexN family lipoprotein n=1 Tax=Piscinibacter aquaticus TaxID=392597 RepID=A0A5C6U0L9_9BURK|nr:hypothetical protein FSC37_01150 [Piscinibacter aquaticus]